MREYHKIQSVYKRDSNNNNKTFLIGQYSVPEFEYLANNQWVFTEKVDGMNIRIIWDGSNIAFGGKTDNAQIPASLVQKLQERFLDKKELFTNKFGVGQVCLYGEGYGAKIQSGGKYRPDLDFVLFDVKIGEWWLQRIDVEDIGKTLGLDVVPIIGEGTLNDMVKITEKGFTSIWGNFICEGIVARPKTELKTRNNERIITKVKYKDFIK